MRTVTCARNSGGRAGTERHCAVSLASPGRAFRYPGRRQVAGISININLHSPVFLQLGNLSSVGAWSASAGAYMKTTASYAMGFYFNDCQMPGCAEFKAACRSGVW